MAILYVQSAGGFQYSTGAKAVAFGSNLAAGNAVVVACLTDTSTAPSISDTQSLTFSLLASFNSGIFGNYFHVWAATGTSAAAETVTLTTAGSLQRIVVAEYSGLSAILDVSLGAGPTSSANPSSGSATTTNANDLIVGLFTNSSGLPSFTQGASFNPTRQSTDNGFFYEDRVVSATGSYAADGTWSGATTWAAFLVSIKAAGGGGTTFFQTLNGSITPAGSLTKQINKALVGASITPAGALTRAVTFGKTLTAGLTFAGSITKMTLKGLAGSITPAGAITKQTNKNLQGATITPSGSLIETFTWKQTLNAAISFVGNLGTVLIVGGSTVINWLGRSLGSHRRRGD